MYKVKKLREE